MDDFPQTLRLTWTGYFVLVFLTVAVGTAAIVTIALANGRPAEIPILLSLFLASTLTLEYCYTAPRGNRAGKQRAQAR